MFLCPLVSMPIPTPVPSSINRLFTNMQCRSTGLIASHYRQMVSSIQQFFVQVSELIQFPIHLRKSAAAISKRKSGLSPFWRKKILRKLFETLILQTLKVSFLLCFFSLNVAFATMDGYFFQAVTVPFVVTVACVRYWICLFSASCLKLSRINGPGSRSLSG